MIHGLDSDADLVTRLMKYKHGRRDSLINLHPLLGDHPHRLQRLEHPLINNRIVD